MIPRILHYVWLGGKKSDMAEKCIESYHKFLPDFEIKEWNESNIKPDEFGKVLKGLYLYYYNKKRFAFCSDIVRLFALKKYGGIYVDTDVEFLKPIPEEILNDKPFLCRDNPSKTVCCGCIWGAEKRDELVIASIKWFEEWIGISKKRFNSCYDSFYGKKWIFNRLLIGFFNLFGYDKENDDTQTVVGYKIYSTEIFNPMDMFTCEKKITDNTVSIHHYSASWNKKLLEMRKRYSSIRDK